MRRKILTILAVSVLFFVVFFLAIFFTLPTESIRHLAEKTIEKQLKQEQSIEIEDLSISPLLNVTLKKFTMRPRNAEPVAENLRTAGGEFSGFWCAPYVEEQAFVIDEIFVNPSIFQIMKKKPAGKFNLKIQDGTIDGELKSKGSMMEVTAVAKAISMNEFALLSNMTGMQIYGNLEFDVRAVMDNGKLAEVNLDMLAANSAICPKRLKLNTPSLPYFELPFTVFGNISAAISVEKDKVKISKLVSDGPDIKLDVKGSVSLKTAANPTPRFDLEVDVTPSSDWVTANNMKVIYQLCEKLDDGSVHLSIRGTAKKPKIDCGTPIPEPVEIAPAEADKPADGDKKDDSKNADKSKRSMDKAEPVKEEAKPEPEPEKVAEVVRPVRDSGSDSVVPVESEMRKRPARPNMQRNNRVDRAASSKLMRERGLDGAVDLRGADKLDENIRRDLKRRGRNFGDVDNSGN